MKLYSPRFVFSICVSMLLVALLAAPLTANPWLQFGESAFELPAPQQQEGSHSEDSGDEKTDDEEAKPEEEPVILPPPVRETISEKFVRFHMWDGSIVGGEIQQDSISIRTEFGLLQVPISDIKKFYPGLDSFPELNSKIEKLVEGLGDKNFDVREKCHRDLSAMGSQVRQEIERFDDKGSAERKKRLEEIKKAIDEELDSFEEDGIVDGASRPLIRGDKVKTATFSMVGKIEHTEFVLTSKFGELKVALRDVRMADRSFLEVDENISKKVEVEAHDFFQKTPRSTRIRVNKGDKISIKADGSINWTNWSTTSTPSGLTNQGKYQNIQAGTLCARIGSSGKVTKIGTKSSFVAKNSGVLYLAIAMQDSYVNNSGYRWVGKYNARIEVKPNVAKQ